MGRGAVQAAAPRVVACMTWAWTASGLVWQLTRVAPGGSQAAIARVNRQWQSSRARCRTRSRGRSSWQTVVVEGAGVEEV
jgi:hypothetical protein